jgi:hypothetical protein
MKAITQTNNLGEAISFFNLKADRLEKVFEEAKKYSKTLTEMRVQIRDLKKRPLPPDGPEEGMGGYSAEEIRFLEEIEAKSRGLSISAGVETLSTDLARVSLQLAEIDESFSRGIITEKEHKHALEKVKVEWEHIHETTTSLLGVDLRPSHLAKEGASKIGSGALGQLTGVASGVMGLMSSLPIAGGLFGLLMYGYSQADRLKAESGEMLNVLVSGGQATSQPFLNHLSGLGEKFQQFYGISRREVQGIVKEFISGGATIEDLMQTTHRNLGEVGQDVVTMTIGLDKMFELASGSSAKLAQALVEDHGVKLGTAVDQLIRIEFAGSRAGAGVGTFTEFVVKTAGELQNFGIGGESVAASLVSLQERYHTVAGLNVQTSIAYAQLGMSQVSQGVQGLNFGLKSTVGELMGYGTGFGAATGLQDAIASNDPNQLVKLIKALNTLAARETEGTGGSSNDTIRQRAYLESIGMGAEGARALTELAKLHGGRSNLQNLTAKELAEFRETLKTEAQKQSEMTQNIHEVLKGMAGMGQSILKLAADFAGLLIVTIKGMMATEALDWMGHLGKAAADGIVSTFKDLTGWDLSDKTAPFKAKTDVDKAVQGQFDFYLKSISGDFSDLLKGTSQVGTGISKVALPLITPIVHAFKEMGVPSDWADPQASTPESRTRSEKGPHYAAPEGPKQTQSGDFWTQFVVMSNRLGVKPEELLKVFNSESGFNSHTVAYRDSHGRATKKDDPDAHAVAKGIQQLTWETARGLGMPKEVWDNFENVSPQEQLKYVERYYSGRAAGKNAAEIYAMNFGGYNNPNGSLYDRDARSKGYHNPGFQEIAYRSNQGLDRDHKGYITAEDLARNLSKVSASQQAALTKVRHTLGMSETGKAIPDPLDPVLVAEVKATKTSAGVNQVTLSLEVHQ